MLKILREAHDWIRDMILAARMRARTRDLKIHELDDADLGRVVKHLMAMIPNPPDLVAVPQSAAILLVASAMESGATVLNVVVKGFTHAGRNVGDWRILVQKLDADGQLLDKPDMDLNDGGLTRRIPAGTSREDVEATFAGFERVTEFSTHIRGTLGKDGCVTHLEVRGTPG